VTHLECGGIYSESFTANCLLVLTVEIFFKNRLICGEVRMYTKNGAIFWPTLAKKFELMLRRAKAYSSSVRQFN